MPRSFSRSLLSMIRSVPETASLARKVPDCFRRQSTSVVLPWSTCAMIAMLRIPDMGPAFGPRGRMSRPRRGGERLPDLLFLEAAREEGDEVLSGRREVRRERELTVRFAREQHPCLRSGLGVQQLTGDETRALRRDFDVERGADSRRKEIRRDVTPFLAVVG